MSDTPRRRRSTAPADRSTPAHTPAARTRKAAAREVDGRSASSDAVDVLVQLPDGEARITIEAEARVRHAAREWMRLVEQLASAAVSPTDLLAELRGDPSSARIQQLTPSEHDELAAAGASPAERDRTHRDLGVRSSWHVKTVADALNVGAAADLLGVDATRVRQRLRARTLYGFRANQRTWLLPRFQFDNGAEIPHLGEVLRVLPADLHPRSVEGFLAVPQPELTAPDGEPTSPREWLRSGGPAAPVVALAESLATQ